MNDKNEDKIIEEEFPSMRHSCENVDIIVLRNIVNL